MQKLLCYKLHEIGQKLLGSISQPNLPVYLKIMSAETTAWIPKLMELLIAPGIGFFGVYVGLKYGLRQLQEQKRLDFIERQLREFYSPLLGYQKIIQAKSELRVKTQNSGGEAWQELCERKRKSGRLVSNDDYEPYQEMIEYDNDQFRSELMGFYNKMLSIFTENYWLAEEETRKWYSDFCKFVELWERWLANKIPPDVIKKLDYPKEKQLQSFYDNLEKQMEKLRNKLSGAKTKKPGK